jgi:hypothetical protein
LFFSMVLLLGCSALVLDCCFPSWGMVDFIFHLITCIILEFSNQGSIVYSLLRGWFYDMLWVTPHHIPHYALISISSSAANHHCFLDCPWLSHSWWLVFLLPFLFGFTMATSFGFIKCSLQVILKTIVLLGQRRFVPSRSPPFTFDFM